MMYNIIFHDGKSIEIDNEQKDAIYKLSGTTTKGVDINDEYISFSGINRIEKVAKNNGYPELPTLKETIKSFTPNRRKRAMQSVIDGFKKHYEGREIPKASQTMLNNWISRVSL